MNSLIKLIYSYLGGSKDKRKQMFLDMGIKNPTVGMKLLEDILHERFNDEDLEKLKLGIHGKDKKLNKAISDLKIKKEKDRVDEIRRTWRSCILPTFEQWRPGSWINAMAMSQYIEILLYEKNYLNISENKKLEKITGIAKSVYGKWNNTTNQHTGLLLKVEYCPTYDKRIELDLGLHVEKDRLNKINLALGE